ncbi:hypothetical protein CIB84_016280 [Bambusicola thoracicus]|uniref:Uncharacterized protein n=1 Tax=Bambusicola thoracicus TaxID=9083 RepID=A0A2P4S792_BAMTH|nr:hypothetical protein CIB84_016280 [Bambusicola thoracicus]
MQESLLYPELMGTPSLLRMLPTAAKVAVLTAVLCRKELWKGAGRTTIIGRGTVMTVESCHYAIAAFDQQGQATRREDRCWAWRALVIAGHGSVLKLDLGEMQRRKESTRILEEPSMRLQEHTNEPFSWLVESQNCSNGKEHFDII